MRRLALTLAALLIAAFAVTGVSAAASAAPADSLYALVNQERAANGLPALTRNANIEAVALNWANQMAANGTLGHNPNYSSQIPAGWTAAAENVAQGQPTAELMHAGWMGSAGHRANILGDFTTVGIAFIRVNGTTWGVQNFAKYAQQQIASPPPPPATPLGNAARTEAHPGTANRDADAGAQPTLAPTPTPTAAPTPAPPSETPQPAPAEQPTAEVSADPVPGSDPSPDATKSPSRAVADSVPSNPAGALTLLGLALTAAVTFIIRSARRGRWGRHRR